VLALRPEDLSQNLNALGLHIDELLLGNEDTQGSDEQPQNRDEQNSDQPSSRWTGGIRQSYNIAPGYIEPVYLAVSKDGETKRQLRAMKWGW
jgi:hypothetical protein